VDLELRFLDSDCKFKILDSLFRFRFPVLD
jgi:hypothetical protein